MTINAQEILTPARAYVYLADVGVAAPVDSVVAPGTGWLSVGLTTPDSLSISTEPEFEEIQSHQSDYPTRRIQTTDSAAIAVDLQQWNENNLVSAYGGGAVTQPDPVASPANYKFTPPSLGGRQEKAALIDVIDGTRNYRWVFPRVMQVEGIELELSKGAESRLALRLAVLGGDATAPWYMLTNDAAFAASA